MNFRITLEDRLHIEKLIKEKKSYNDICALIGIGRTTLRQEIKRCPRGKYNGNEAHQQHLNIWIERKKRMTKKFTDADENLIKKRMEQGSTRSSIRKELGASFNALEKWFTQNAPDYKSNTISCLEERLLAIEQHIEILFDLFQNQKN